MGVRFVANDLMAPVHAAQREDIWSVSCYGVHIRLRVGAHLSKYLPMPLIPGTLVEASQDGAGARGGVDFSLRQSPASTGEHTYTISAGKKTLAVTDNLPEAVAVFQSHLHEAVARRAREWIFVHAGVVGWQGKAILVPGRSRSGKSTLVMALVDAGATYYSDEYAVLDKEGRVHPFTRVPQLRAAYGPGDCSEPGGRVGRRGGGAGTVARGPHSVI
jgi:hypothetical protein